MAKRKGNKKKDLHKDNKKVGKRENIKPKGGAESRRHERSRGLAKDPHEVRAATGGKRVYILFFRDVRLGPVVLSDSAPSNLSGTLTLDSATDHPRIRRRVANYIQFRTEASQLAQDSPHSLEEFLNLTEPGFVDLINSDEWALVDPQGNRVPILAPTFSGGRTLKWQWRERPI